MSHYAKISISQNGRWAGDGIINSGIIYDCSPSLTHALYEAIEAAIARGQSSVHHNGIRYSWTISDQVKTPGPLF